MHRFIGVAVKVIKTLLGGMRLLAVGLVLMATPGALVHAAQEGSKATWGIPWAENDLVAARNLQNYQKIRQHGWAVWAAVTRPLDATRLHGPAAWEMWYTHQETFSRDPGGCRKLRTGGNGMLRSATGESAKYTEHSRKILVVSILYNEDACQHIRKEGLYRTAVLDNLVNRLGQFNVPNYQHDIPPFPRTAMIIKANWRRVPRNGGHIPVWLDGTSSPRYVAITVSHAGEPCRLAEWNGTDAIPTACFYNAPVTHNNHSDFPQNTVDDGDVFILVGLHIITKELPEWTWTTFWWSPRPDLGTYAQGRPDQSILRGVWRNYVMDTTLSMDTPWETQQETAQPDVPDACGTTVTQGRAKICFNPYLEGRNLSQAGLSNCMNCHIHATYPAMATDFRDNVERGYIGTNASCFKNRMRLDYLWTLVPRTGTAGEPIRSAFRETNTRGEFR
jgi:hypothetical protein